MAWQTLGTVMSFEAGATITKNRVVAVNSSGKLIHPATNDSNYPVGIAMEGGVSGASIPVIVNGVARVEAAAAIAAGAPVCVDIGAGTGTIDDATIVNAVTNVFFHFLVGVALEAAGAAGEVISVLIQPSVYINGTDAAE